LSLRTPVEFKLGALLEPLFGRLQIFYAVTAAVTGQLAAIAVDVEALVLFLSLTKLLLAAVVFQVVKA
jgi:hypothetical protein